MSKKYSLPGLRIKAGIRSELLEAHKYLDQAMYALSGIRKAMGVEAARPELLFRKYIEMVALKT